jgi:LacI family transcriptional regulator
MDSDNRSPQTPNVLVVMETSFEFGREVIRGIGHYCRAHQPWNIEFFDPRQNARYLQPSAKSIRGVIGRIPTPEFARRLRRLGAPTVCLASGVAGIRTDIGTSQEAICRLAIEHFVDRGFRNLAFYGRYSPHGENRWRCFQSLAVERGLRFAGSPTLRRGDIERVAAWLKALPTPLGLLCSDDVAAMHAINAARIAEISIPDQIAVLGIDNDALICDITNPRLSSVALNAQRIGYAAAEMLSTVMEGGVAGDVVDIPPIGVVQRQSTDVMATDDRDVREAAKFIRENALRPIEVAEVVEHVGLSRRSLEMRFRAALGKSIHEEMQRIRLDRAKGMLTTTDFKIDLIARRSGFKNGPYLHRVFKRHSGMTPVEYRREVGRFINLPKS